SRITDHGSRITYHSLPLSCICCYCFRRLSSRSNLPDNEVLMFRKVAALVIVFIAILLSGCSLLSHEAPNEDVDKAADLFFQRLDKGYLDGIYKDASKKLMANKPQATVIESLRQLGAQGKTQGFDRISMTIQGEGKDRMLLPVYRV